MEGKILREILFEKFLFGEQQEIDVESVGGGRGAAKTSVNVRN